MTEQTSWPPAGSEPTATPSAEEWFRDLANRASGAEAEAAPTAGAVVVAQPAGPVLPAAAAAPSGTRRAHREAERADAARSRRAPRLSARPEADARTAPSAAPHGRRQAAGPRSAAPRTSAASAAAAAPRVSGASMGRAIASKGFPALVMASVAMLLVGTTVPANALFDPESTPASLAFSSLPSTEAATTAEQLDVEAQAIEGEMSEDLATAAASRDEWGVTTYAEMLRLRYGSTNYAYTASGSGAIRWPFPFAAPITSAFGERAAPCYGCSTYHRGLDIDAGYGAPVGAIADGIVIAVGRSVGYGYRVEIEHVINGQKVMSRYAHMIDNSSVLAVGDTVVAGEIVGAVGNTGLSTGAHLHLEIHVDDVAIDPFAWLKANAG
ncbi:peptidoglycan DD-metalloendopeptidase family protein [Microcella frigidaquae]|uniref:Murein DD-endopeptidase MepM/ murein hydrolase activator NlpD n=1 Tax=Microcella frigidaquae TaxID=424758 RepID=A0A840X7F5_9MICO|nr:murein DD-endopeptidase MepM/ murein hydrolase activator NlpD [Microcella frigidaquae]NHN44775.1 M23 family metallopeptidase [Microcella frigidaquae]